jgi:hypothetical protein
MTEADYTMFNFRWATIRKEVNKIGLLSDETEKAARSQLINNIIDKVNEYNSHISDYEYAQKMQEIADRGVVFIPYSKASTIKSNWSKLFASSVSNEDKKEIRYDRYKWHIFSFEKINALSQIKARQAFNKCKKDKVYVFYQYKDAAFYIENPHLLKSTDFDSDDDIYVFDTVYKWTYIHTHEIQCGPYFYRIK